MSIYYASARACHGRGGDGTMCHLAGRMRCRIMKPFSASTMKWFLAEEGGVAVADDSSGQHPAPHQAVACWLHDGLAQPSLLQPQVRIQVPSEAVEHGEWLHRPRMKRMVISQFSRVGIIGQHTMVKILFTKNVKLTCWPKGACSGMATRRAPSARV